MMEKKRINIICLCMSLLLCINLWHGFRGGKDGLNDNSDDSKEHYVSARIHISPVGNYSYPESTDNGSSEAVKYRKSSIVTPVEVSTASMIFSAFFILVLLVATITGINCLIRFIIDIKKGHIFTHKNIKRMRLLSLCLFLGFLFVNYNSYIGYIAAKKVLMIPGYVIDDFQLKWGVLWVVVIFALFAEVFAIGLRLKEEQDLTI